MFLCVFFSFEESVSTKKNYLWFIKTERKRIKDSPYNLVEFVIEFKLNLNSRILLKHERLPIRFNTQKSKWLNLDSQRCHLITFVLCPCLMVRLWDRKVQGYRFYFQRALRISHGTTHTYFDENLSDVNFLQSIWKIKIASLLKK